MRQWINSQCPFIYCDSFFGQKMIGVIDDFGSIVEVNIFNMIHSLAN
jgi:hypothetical protein